MSEINRWSTSAAGTVQNAAGYFPEGQAPSTLNDAARTIMAELRRDWQTHNPDVTATYSAQTYSVTYDRNLSSGELSQVFCFIPDSANTGTASLNVNSLGAKEIIGVYGNHLPANSILAQVPAVVAYNKSADKFHILNPADPTTGALPTLSYATAQDSDLLSINDVSTGADSAMTVLNGRRLLGGYFGSQWTASGASNDWTVADWSRRITLIFSGVSLSGASDILVQVGDSGGIETTSYVSTEGRINGTNTCALTTSTSGFRLVVAGAGRLVNGTLTLSPIGDGSDTIIASWTTIAGSGVLACHGAGQKVMSSSGLATVRVTNTNAGTDSFNAGTISIFYE